LSVDTLDQTDLSEAEAAVIINRLVRYLEMMPMAIHQAHERIIGERVVPNDEKILSLYEPHAEVYVRGKAGADAEFGLQLLLSESAEGLIVDCHLVPEGIQSDSTLLMPAIKRMRAALGESVASTVVTDRGFSSAANSDALKALDIVDSTLPRNSGAMQKMLASSTHRALHRRRAQTEARIGIFKANFLGDQLPTKGLVAQQRYVAWAALSHNLWVLGRLDVAEAAAEAA
jgi:IS5 family transposase